MFDIIEREKKRQRESIVLIASEVIREMGCLSERGPKEAQNRYIMMRLLPLIVLDIGLEL